MTGQTKISVSAGPWPISIQHRIDQTDSAAPVPAVIMTLQTILILNPAENMPGCSVKFTIFSQYLTTSPFVFSWMALAAYFFLCVKIVVADLADMTVLATVALDVVIVLLAVAIGAAFGERRSCVYRTRSGT